MKRSAALASMRWIRTGSSSRSLNGDQMQQFGTAAGWQMMIFNVVQMHMLVLW
jgi:hypothetical protein